MAIAMTSSASPAAESPSVGRRTVSSLSPVRNNYAASHTPIASAKRPRQPANKALDQPKDVTTPITTPSEIQKKYSSKTSSFHYNEQQMSPMHPPRPVPQGIHGQNSAGSETEQTSQGCVPESSTVFSNSVGNSSWVGRKVDAIFSPVLNFLNGKHNANHSMLKSGDRSINEDLDDLTENILTRTHGDMFHLESEEFLDDGNHIDNLSKTDSFENSTDTTAVTRHEHVPNHSSTEEESADFEEEFNPYLFIKTLPQYSSVVSDPFKKICLPPKLSADPRISLVLDLDETLVHCTVEHIHDADMTFPVSFHGVDYLVNVRIRPYLKDFFEAVSKKFEVIIFTASQKAYANELLNRLDPYGKYIRHRLFRESCLFVEGNYLKDLHVLGRNLSSCVLVDNSPHAFGYQIDNGIPIESWFDDVNDTELLKLERFLNTLHDVDDVRAIIRSKFQTYKRVRDA